MDGSQKIKIKNRHWMRKTTERVYKAFMKKEKFKSSNTQVKIINNFSHLYLFDNLIAKETIYGIVINSCGWNSATTAERLKPFVKIRLAKREFIINEEFVWDGKDLNLNTLENGQRNIISRI